jgi:hypothetical protein
VTAFVSLSRENDLEDDWDAFQVLPIVCRNTGAEVANLLDATLKLAQSQNMRQAASLRVGAAALLWTGWCP